jgi:hypothetical protein
MSDSSNIFMPNRRIGLVNVVFVCQNKMSCVGVVSTGGGEEKCKGRKAVDFEQGARVDGTCATMKIGLPSPVSAFLILISREKRSHLKYVSA